MNLKPCSIIRIYEVVFVKYRCLNINDSDLGYLGVEPRNLCI